MKFKVGDIVRYTGEGFMSFLYDKDHIVINVEERRIHTQGHGWDYRDFGWPFDHAGIGKHKWDGLEIVNRKSWSDSKLTFKFINTDVESLK